MAVAPAGTVVSTYFPGSDKAFKMRPCLILATYRVGTTDMCFCCLITASNNHGEHLFIELPSKEKGGFMPEKSFIAPRYCYSATANSIAKEIGRISQEDLGLARQIIIDLLSEQTSFPLTA
jgi:hypothetical protein